VICNELANYLRLDDNEDGTTCSSNNKIPNIEECIKIKRRLRSDKTVKIWYDLFKTGMNFKTVMKMIKESEPHSDSKLIMRGIFLKYMLSLYCRHTWKTKGSILRMDRQIKRVEKLIKDGKFKGIIEDSVIKDLKNLEQVGDVGDVGSSGLMTNRNNRINCIFQPYHQPGQYDLRRRSGDLRRRAVGRGLRAGRGRARPVRCFECG